MTDILGDTPDHGRTRVAEPARQEALPKRFYEKAEIVENDGAYEVRLDGRPVRTPGRSLLAFPRRDMADAVAAEWAAQGERIDPVTMPATRLANTAIDGVAPAMDAVREDIVRYAGSDLVCYRADGPEGLVEREAERWDPFLDWAQRELGANFVLAEGVMHVDQPAEAIRAVARTTARIEDPFRLAATHVMTSLTGSALIALAVTAGAFTGDEAWQAAHVDEDWNTERWGEDAEAAERRALRERDMRIAVLFATG